MLIGRSRHAHATVLIAVCILLGYGFTVGSGPPDSLRQVLAVTPDAGGTTVSARATGLVQFVMINTGAGTLSLDLTCGKDDTRVVSCQVQGPNPVDVPPDNFVDVTVAYTAGTPGIGELTLQAVDGSVSDEGSFAVTVEPAPLPTVTTTVSTDTVPSNVDTKAISFIVSNTGETSGQFSLSCGSTNSAIISTCAGPTSIVQGVGAVDTLEYTMTRAGTGGSSNVWVQAAYAPVGSALIASADTTAVFVPTAGGTPSVQQAASIPAYQTADAGTVDTASFSVYNPGPGGANYLFTCTDINGGDCDATIASQTIPDDSTIAVGVPYIVPSSAGAYSVTLTATHSVVSGKNDTGSAAVTVGAPQAGSGYPIITPETSTLIIQKGAVDTVQFNVYNDGDGIDTVSTFSCTPSGPVSCTDQAAASQFVLSAGGEVDIPVQVTADSVVGAGAAQLNVTSSDRGNIFGSVAVVVTGIPSPPELSELYSGVIAFDAGTRTDTLMFTLSNSGDASGAYSVWCEDQGAPSCLFSAEVDTVGAEGNRVIPVRVSATGAGSGSITLNASLGADTTAAPVTIHYFNGRPVVTSLGVGPHDTIDWDQGIDTIQFQVSNPGDTTLTYDLGCSSQLDAFNCVTPNHPSASIMVAALADSVVDVEVTILHAGLDEITLTASVELAGTTFSDSDSRNVLAIAPKPPVDLSPTAEHRMQRSACVTAAAGPAAAFQCGELRLAHAMPSFRTLSRDRTLTLAYTSGTADPTPTVMVDFTLPADVTVPDSVHGRLIWGADTINQAFDTLGIRPGESVRVSFMVDQPESQLTTGVYEYSVEFEGYLQADPDTLCTGCLWADTAEYVVVNRVDSPYGAGWQVGGIDQLHLDLRNDALLLEGSDGSAALYEVDPSDSTRWIAPAGTYRDTIILENFSGGAGAITPSSLDLTGSQYGSKSSPTGMQGVSQLTWAFWIKNDSPSRKIGGITQGSDPNRVWWLETDNSGSELRVSLFNADTDNPAWANFTGLTPNSWHFVLVQFDGTESTSSNRLKVWIDGSSKTAQGAVGTFPDTLHSSSSADFQWGRVTALNSGYSGDMGETAILQGLLTAQERSDWYEFGIDFGRAGLVAAYRWDDNLNDASNTGNNLAENSFGAGTYDGATDYPARTPAADRPGGVLSVDGTEYGSLSGGNHSGLMNQTEMTWAFWINNDAQSGSIGGVTDGSTERVWWMDADNSGSELRVVLFNASADNPSFRNFTGLTPGAWHFVVVKFDGSQSTSADRLRVWIDGSEKAVDSSAGATVPTAIATSSSAPFEWGKVSAHSSSFSGDLGELIILDELADSLDIANWRIGGIDYSTTGVVAGYRWVGDLDDVSVENNDLTKNGIDSSNFDTTSAYPSRPSGGPSGSFYTRHLKNGLQILFDTSGRQRWVVDRTGQQVEYTYVGSSTALESIQIAPHEAYLRYSLTYVSGKLDKITDPGDRQLEVSIVSNDLVTFTDPDADSVTITYDGHRARTRTSRRGNVTTYAYHGTSPLLGLASLPAVSGGTPSTTFTPIQVRGQISGTGTDTVLPLAAALLEIDGPRTDAEDVTTFAVNQYQAPTRITNPLGDSTLIEYANTTFPLLPTLVRDPVGFLSTSTYDARGNVTQVRGLNPLGDGNDAVTRFVYHDVWEDMVATVVPPEGDSTMTDYDSRGNRIWTQDLRGSSSRVTFSYEALFGLPAVTTYPASGAADSVFYDPKTGNHVTTATPTGVRTNIYRDQFGRDTLSTQRVDSAGAATTNFINTRRTWDVLNRVTQEMTFGSGASVQNGSVGADASQVSYNYDPDGNITQVTRSALPDRASIGALVTNWAYDAIGRTVAEYAPDGTSGTPFDGPADSTVFDLTGNPVEVHTRRGDTIVKKFDAANQMVKRRYSARPDTGVWKGIPARDTTCPGGCFGPKYGYAITGDTAFYAYDERGLLLQATNAFSEVLRTYLPGGALDTDFLSITRLDSIGNLGSHNYGLRYTYDLNGRRTKLYHPGDIAPSTDSVTAYEYHEFGALSKITDPFGNDFTFDYNLDSQLSLLALPGGALESRTYGLDGQLDRFHVYRLFQSPSLRDTYVQHDGRGRMTAYQNRAGAADTLTLTHTPLGQVLNSTLTSTIFSVETQNSFDYTAIGQYSYDALGNRTSAIDSTSTPGGSNSWSRNASSVTYEAGTGRMAKSASDTISYDLAGNVIFKTDVAAGDPANDLASFYDGLGRVRAQDARDNKYALTESGYRRTIEQYWYDALDRRVLVDAARNCEDIDASNYPAVAVDCQFGRVRRTVWNGQQELYEIQSPNTTAATREDDLGPHELAETSDLDRNPFFGRVVYTSGPGIDQPLSIGRMAYTMWSDSAQDQITRPDFAIVPYWNFTGHADDGLITDSTVELCSDAPPEDCVNLGWEPEVSIYGNPELFSFAWHGQILRDKRDLTGTLYRRNRHYDPATGQFTQEDPIGLAGGLNLYGYAGGDPVNFSDPFGLSPCGGMMSISCVYHMADVVNQVALDIAVGINAAGATVASFFTPGPDELVIGAAALRLGRGGSAAQSFGPRLLYEANSKHSRVSRGRVSAGILDNAQGLLDGSLNVKSGLRVAGDRGAGKFSVFRSHRGGRFHGYQVDWKDLTQEMKNVLIDGGIVNARGRFR